MPCALRLEPFVSAAVTKDEDNAALRFRSGREHVERQMGVFRQPPGGDFYEKLEVDHSVFGPDDCRRLQRASCAGEIRLEDREALRAMEAKGVKAVSWERADVQALREFVRQNVWPEWAAKSPLSRKMHDSQLKWLKRIGKID